jgi:serine/threonine-protein kinase
MLTGKLPLNAETATELARMHRDVPPIAPRKVNPSIPVDLERILLKVLAKEPSARYRTADQFGQMLSTFGRTPDLIPIPVPVETPPVQISTPKPEVKRRPQQQSEPFEQKVNRVLESALHLDWITISLGLLAFAAVGGLFPYWSYIFSFLSTIQ